MKETTKRKSLVDWIMEYASTKKRLYVHSVIFALLGALCAMVPYYFMAVVVQKLLGGKRDFGDYGMELACIAVFWLLRIIFHSLSTSRSHAATFAVLGNIRKEICEKLTKVPLGDVQNIPSGSLKNIIVERVDSMETTLAHILPEVTSNVIAFALTFIFMCLLNFKLAFASLITLPIGMICMMGMMKDHGAKWANCTEKTKVLNEVAVEYINGIEVIKAFSKTEGSYERFRTAANEGARCYIDWMRDSIVYFTTGMVITPSILLPVLPIGGFMYINGTVSAADFIMIIILSFGLLTPLVTVMSYKDDWDKAHTIFEEVGELLAMGEMHRPDSSSEQIADHTIRLRDVHFGYEEGKEILHGISMELEGGSVNAFVGPSGSGKSTIARLIASFWDVTSGSISIGGTDIRNIPFKDYSRLISYVSQDNYLFNVSIRENIRMGNKGATDKEVEETAKRCGCHEFIRGLEKGYDTVVGDAGGHLSGGERQRISIARAMMKDAPIVVLDEATAYTDPENEALIQQSLAKIIQGKTVIMIAHRLSTIKEVDQIFVVKDGEIDSQGTHDELVAKNGLYRKMWDMHISSRDEFVEVS